ncbi:MAG: AMP-binding protein, partial [Bdellovibrio sp.]
MKVPSILFQDIWSQFTQRPDPVLSYHKDFNDRWIPVRTTSYLKNILMRVLVFKNLGLEVGDRLILSIHSGYEFDLLEKAAFCMGLNLLCVDRFTPTPLLVSYFNPSDKSLFLADENSLLSEIQLKVPSCKVRQVLLLQFREQLKIYEKEQLSDLEKKVEETMAREPNPQDREFWDHLTCYTITTSGSTGSPKVLCYTQKQVLDSIHEISLFLGKISPGEVVISWLPMSNLFQRVFNLIALRLGAVLYYEDNPKRLPSSLRQIRPSILIGVPFFFDKVNKSVRDRLDTLSRGLLKRS